MEQMEQIELVIRMPKEAYDEIKGHNGVSYAVEDWLSEVEWAIRHGTPLPKGHGRLVDENEVTSSKSCEGIRCSDCSFSGGAHCGMWAYVKGCETMVEADKEGEN